MIFMEIEKRPRIEAVKEVFERWRIENPDRHTTPLAIRQMVVDLIGEYSLSRICRDLNLTMSNVKKWKMRLAEDRAFFESGGGATQIVSQPEPEKPPAVMSAKEFEAASPEVTFLELGNIVGGSSQTIIEWKKANGESMRLVGSMSSKQVELLVQRFLSSHR
jgi:hypothetical protein